MQQADIIIIGSGVVGLTLAGALAGTDLDIILLEAKPDLPSWKLGDYQLRVSAITRASQQVFRHVSVWQDILAMRTSPYRKMHVWDSTGCGTIHFDAADIGEPELGHIIENAVIQQALLKRIQQADNIRILPNTQLQTLDVTGNNPVVSAADSTQFSAKVLVGADGAQSWLRDKCNIGLYSKAYGHTAIVATLKTEKPHELTASQRFMPEGPLAFLPLKDPHYSSIVWSSEIEQATTLLSLNDAAFAKATADAFDYRLGNIDVVSKRVSFPLVMRHVKHYVLPGVAFIGDAAHTLHPLAGQGVNLGILDSACLAQVLLAAHAKDRPLGSLDTLRRYERWRKGHNWAMISAMEGFKRLFASKQTVLTQLRNQGLSLTDRAPLAKNVIMRRAMGLTGDLPNLARI